MNSILRNLTTFLKSNETLGFRSIVRRTSTLAHQQIIASSRISYIWDENKYLSDYFSQSFEMMNISKTKVNNNHIIYKLIDKVIELSHQRESMDHVEYSASLTNLFQDITSQLKLMNQVEIASLLNSLKDDKRLGIKASTKLIDLELRWLLKSYLGTGLMDLDLSLYLAHIFYTGSIRSTYVSILIKHLSQNVQTMTNQQLVYTLFLIMLNREQSPIFYNYNNQIKDIVATGSIHDIATVCMAYFKTKTKIPDLDLNNLIIDRFIELLPEMDLTEPGYCAIVKCLRYSRHQESRSNILRLIKLAMSQSVMLTSPYNIVHTLKLMETYRIYDETVLQLVYNILMENIDQFRIKDIQYIMSSLSNFAFNDLVLKEEDRIKLDLMCDQIANQTREDSDKHHYHVLPLMRAFAMFGYYNEKLNSYVDECLTNPNLLNAMTTTIEFEKNLLLLHAAAKIETNIEPFPRAKALMRKLSNSLIRSGNIGFVKNDLSLDHLSFIINGRAKHLTISNTMRDIASELSNDSELKGSYNFSFQHTFAHQNYGDLIISKNVKNPGNFDSKTLLPAKVPEGQIHHAVLPITRHDLIDGSSRISGFKNVISRLLTKSGYNVIYAKID